MSMRQDTLNIYRDLGDSKSESWIVPGISLLGYVAAALSVMAALVHLWLMPAHIEESVGYGVFFAAIALAQGVYGVALLCWPARGVLVAGALGTLAVLALYLAERATRASLGPHSEHAASFEIIAMLCTALELGLLCALLLDAKRLLYLAEVLSFGAALIHLLEAHDSYGVWWGYVTFFLAVAVAQGLYCLALPHFGGRGGRASFLLAGIAGNLSVVAVWVFTRTVGIPYIRTTGITSPELRIGKTEGVGVADLGATTTEMALIVVLTVLAVSLYRREGFPGDVASQTVHPETTQNPLTREGVRA